MPESPEVTELARFLSTHAVGRTITGLDVLLGSALKTPHPALDDLRNARIVSVERRGKMIDIGLASGEGDPRHVIVHFGHDGWVLWHERSPDGQKRAGDATLMVRVRLDDGSGFDLTDAGQWKGLSIHVVADPTEVPAVAKLGPDPLGVDSSAFVAVFISVLAGRKKQIKALLQDQTVFAGIGNAYSDEILHAAGVSPRVHAATLSTEEATRLAEHTLTVLAVATRERRGVAPSELRATKHAALRVHRKTGQACPVCGDVIREFTSSGASAQYCPTCQTGGALVG